MTEHGTKIVDAYDSGTDWDTIADDYGLSISEAMNAYREEKYEHWNTGWELQTDSGLARFKTGCIETWTTGTGLVGIEEIADEIPLSIAVADSESENVVDASLDAQQARRLAETLAECADILEGKK